MLGCDKLRGLSHLFRFASFVANGLLITTKSGHAVCVPFIAELISLALFPSINELAHRAKYNPVRCFAERSLCGTDAIHYMEAACAGSVLRVPSIDDIFPRRVRFV